MRRDLFTIPILLKKKVNERVGLLQEIQIRTIARDPCMSTRMVNFKWMDNSECWQGCEATGILNVGGIINWYRVVTGYTHKILN